MSVKLRSVHACELHFPANAHTAGAAHAGSVHHDRVKADNGGDAQFLGESAHEFHHDHGTDGNTDIVLLTFIFNQVLDDLGNHALALIRTIICCYVKIACNCLQLIFQD